MSEPNPPAQTPEEFAEAIEPEDTLWELISAWLTAEPGYEAKRHADWIDAKVAATARAAAQAERERLLAEMRSYARHLMSAAHAEGAGHEFRCGRMDMAKGLIDFADRVTRLSPAPEGAK